MRSGVGRRGRLVAALSLAVLVPGACAGAGGGGPDVTVLAAASLTGAVTALAEAFEESHPGSHIEVGFGPSSGLREQVLAGAPAGVLASADPGDVRRLAEAGEVRTWRPFARNRLEIAVPAGNPAGVRSLADFGDPDLVLGLCAEEVPCGRYARRALAAAGVAPALDTNATDVRALLTQVASGDLDAGIVYRTDVLSAGGEVEGIEIPPAANVVAEYVIAVLAGAGDPGTAAAFVAFVASEEGEAVLRSFGFDPA